MDDPVEPPPADREGGPGADEDVRVQLQRYAALVEHAPDAIVVLDVTAGRLVEVNPAAEQLFGLAREELLTVGPAQLSPPVQPDGRPSAEVAAEYIARAVAGEQPRVDWTHRRADGRAVACEITLFRLPGGERQLVGGSILECTERREAASARRAADQAHAAREAAEAGAARLQAMVAGLNVIVWERDAASWRIRYINQRADELLGYPVSRWLTDENLWTEIIDPADRDRVLAAVAEGIAAGGDFALDYRVRARDGRRVWLQQLGHVTHGADGAPTVHAVLVDITEHKRREQASTLLAAAGRLIAGPGTVEQRLTAVADLAPANSATGPRCGCAARTTGTGRWPPPRPRPLHGYWRCPRGGLPTRSSPDSRPAGRSPCPRSASRCCVRPPTTSGSRRWPTWAAARGWWHR